jgi:hypothetical protein
LVELARYLIICYSCRYSACIQADLKLGSAVKGADILAGKPYLSKTNSNNFELNNQFLLGLQIPGSGRKEAEISLGISKLSKGFMTKRYTELQNKLGLFMIGISKETLEERDGFCHKKAEW